MMVYYLTCSSINALKVNGNGNQYSKKIKKPGRIGSNTEYVIALLPLGGYVKMAGIIDESMDTDLQYEKDEFMSQPLWAKIWILSAGVIMNTILAFVIFASIGYYQGTPEIKNEAVVGELQIDKPAQLAGILQEIGLLKLMMRESIHGMTLLELFMPNLKLRSMY